MRTICVSGMLLNNGMATALEAPSFLFPTLCSGAGELVENKKIYQRPGAYTGIDTFYYFKQILFKFFN